MPAMVGNAPCSWGVEFAEAPSNPPWRTVLDETSAAGYRGIELGPIGYMPEDPAILRDHLQARRLALTAGVLFRPFHDSNAWSELLDALHRTCRMLASLGARHLVLIDSIQSERSKSAGNARAAPRLARDRLAAIHGRLSAAARISRDEYGLQACLHGHAGGCIEFEDEIEQALDAIDEDLLAICLDTGHSLYAGFDPVDFFRRHSRRVRYIHLKDLDKTILQRSIAQRVGFYEACARGVFCNLGRGAMDFAAFREALRDARYEGWSTVEQDRGPLSVQSSFADARANLEFLASVELAG